MPYLGPKPAYCTCCAWSGVAMAGDVLPDLNARCPKCEHLLQIGTPPGWRPGPVSEVRYAIGTVRAYWRWMRKHRRSG